MFDQIDTEFYRGSKIRVKYMLLAFHWFELFFGLNEQNRSRKGIRGSKSSYYQNKKMFFIDNNI